MSTKLAAHSTVLIWQAIQGMVIAQGFKFIDDLSDTDKGTYKNKSFKMDMPEVTNSDRSNRQKFRVSGDFSVVLFHNAQGSTTETAKRILEDVENIVFDIEIFAPVKFSEAKDIKQSTKFERWRTEPVKAGDDSVLKTTIDFTIQYVINNPLVV